MKYIKLLSTCCGEGVRKRKYKDGDKYPKWDYPFCDYICTKCNTPCGVITNFPTKDELSIEFRMIISHALLGDRGGAEIEKENFDLMINECSKYVRKLIVEYRKQHK